MAKSIVHPQSLLGYSVPIDLYFIPTDLEALRLHVPRQCSALKGVLYRCFILKLKYIPV